ncbi:ATP-dependent zinc metalloprotease FtsH [Sandaracinus amylolyticus]|uniref:ATP-dependent zinc metalloprotease FtsH n=1 Tax=Sandaracinus amylolyticus TaxID=927083 RepID=UPI0009465056|nr:ATP-dependent zinc metalloprotease FtsH [Sandaracinus amylolyticus]
MDPQGNRRLALTVAYVVLVTLLLWVIQSFASRPPPPRSVPYSELVSLVEQNRVEEATVRADRIIAKLRPAADAPAAQDAPSTPRTAPAGTPDAEVERVYATRIPDVDDAPLLANMRQHGVTFSGEMREDAWWQPLLFGWVLPFAVLFGIYMLVMRRVTKNAGPLSVGKAQAKIYDRNAQEPVNFEDVAGVDEAKAELVEIVSYLKHPERYRAIGARSPKGVLLVGPPGTGKTLLARAVAGEAQVPFFSISGSEFVQMFVGVGAARVRDLFEQAKQRAPCIVFIDELDAIGRSRSGAGSGLAVHEEREQTLNQLLVEMDGFEAGKGVVILAATNRPEVLDPALLRAGRFDRQVAVDRPDVRGREAILRVHVRKIRVAKHVDMRVVAQRTPGMAGADLANVVNEAALAASRRGAAEVETRDFEEAVDRIQLGLKKKGRVMTEPERERVAYHEGGHALVALSVQHADPVHRVTIIPRSIGALGATLQLPAEERYLMTRNELRDRICVMLGGRAAELVAFDDLSTGAQNDLERATETARHMVCRFGMSDALGPVTYGEPMGGRFLEIPGLHSGRGYSEETARAIDAEVRRIIEDEEKRALALLEERRRDLEAIAARLLENETIDRDELERIAAPRLRTGSRPPPPSVPEVLGDPGHMKPVASNGDGRR